MEHNRSKDLGENIDILFSGYNTNSFTMYKLVGDADIEEVSVDVDIVSIEDNIYKQNVTMPDEVCIVMVKFNTKVMFIRVGNPDYELVYYYGSDKGTISWKQIDNDDNKLDNGDMNYRGEGVYTIKPSVLDYSILMFDGNRYTLDVPYTSESYGTILLNNNVWQELAIPVTGVNVKDYFIDWVDNKIKEYDSNASVNDVIERVSAYPGDLDKTLTYVVGSTPDTAEGNFELVRVDGDAEEITAFFCKVLDYHSITDGEDIIFEWRR